MNEFDLLLGFILFLGIGYGAVRGPGRQIAGLVSFWLALIISLWLFKPFSEKILQGVFVGSSAAVMDSFAFIILMVVFTVAVQLVFIFSSTAPEEKRKKSKQDLNQMLDEVDKKGGGKIFSALGGMVMGFITTAIWMSVLLALAQHLLFSTSAFGGGIRISMTGSKYMPLFNTVLQWVYTSVKFFTPGELPSIFRGLLG